MKGNKVYPLDEIPDRPVMQGCGLCLDASVSRPSGGAVVPRLGLASVSTKNASCTSLVGGGHACKILVTRNSDEVDRRV